MTQTNLSGPETLTNGRENRPFENKEPERREWKWSELMSEEQSRRLREVSRKKNLKLMRAAARRP